MISSIYRSIYLRICLSIYRYRVKSGAQLDPSERPDALVVEAALSSCLEIAVNILVYIYMEMYIYVYGL